MTSCEVAASPTLAQLPLTLFSQTLNVVEVLHWLGMTTLKSKVISPPEAMRGARWVISTRLPVPMIAWVSLPPGLESTKHGGVGPRRALGNTASVAGAPTKELLVALKPPHDPFADDIDTSIAAVVPGATVMVGPGCAGEIA